jgi:hypothetical protein
MNDDHFVPAVLLGVIVALLVAMAMCGVGS